MTASESLPSLPSDPLWTRLATALSPRYALEREIGRGGMGIVYRAHDTRLKRWVAVKLLPPELAYRPNIRSRFLREAETAAQLSHPNIVPIYTVEEVETLVFFVMAYVAGTQLGEHLAERGTLPVPEVRRVLREVADALAYAHARNVVHRDVKPDNILLDAESGRAMVTDFGIARAVREAGDPRLTSTGEPIGTPAYMSPEQCGGDQNIDGRSDLYSLGVVGYQLLCGVVPFSAPSAAAVYVKHLTEEPPPVLERMHLLGVREDVQTRVLSEIIMRCLAKHPESRFMNARELIVALEAVPKAPSSTLGMQDGTRGGALSSEAGGMPSAAFLVQGHAGQAPAMVPSAEELKRWESTPVRKYRKKLVSFVAVNTLLVPFGFLFSQESLFAIPTIWAIALGRGYYKLWERGFDWRDVFRRSRDTLFVDVVGETVDSTRAIFDPARRSAVRERLRERRRRQPGLLAPWIRIDGSPPPPPPSTANRDESLSRIPAVRDAAQARADIHRALASLPEADRLMIPDVASSADALYERIELLATRAGELGHADVPGMGEAIEREIAALEAEANPLDEVRSERRVRRLAQLRRQRISLRDLRARRELMAQNLERCVSAMQTIRMDLIRLGSGSQSYETVTQLAEQALRLGGEVDVALYARDEIARVLGKSA